MNEIKKQNKIHRKIILESLRTVKEMGLKKAVMVFKETCDRLGKEIEEINKQLKELEDG